VIGTVLVYVACVTQAIKEVHVEMKELKDELLAVIEENHWSKGPGQRSSTSGQDLDGTTAVETFVVVV
jgi:chromosome condensin MukBEF MukE localization factor